MTKPGCLQHPECGCPRDLHCVYMPPKPRWGGMILVGIAVAVLVGITWVFMWTTRAEAHDAMPTAAQPEGWKYPYSCCSGLDCRAVPEREGNPVPVSESREGYVISSTGEVIGFGDPRLKDSPDGLFHWCSVAGASDSRTICLFVPPRSY